MVGTLKKAIQTRRQPPPQLAIADAVAGLPWIASPECHAGHIGVNAGHGPYASRRCGMVGVVRGEALLCLVSV